MRIRTTCLLALLALALPTTYAQGTIPTFKRAMGGATYTLAGRDPAQSGTTVIPTVLVPVTLSFDGKAARMDAAPDLPRILKSPIFSPFAFASGDKTQYADAMLRATFPADAKGHTLLGKPEVKPITIAIPVGYGYLLTSKKNGASFAVVDFEFLQKELFQQLPRQDGKLVIAVTHNTTYYAAADATVCCSWGTHGVDAATGNSFVLGSYLRDAPAVVDDATCSRSPSSSRSSSTIRCTIRCIHGRNVTRLPGTTSPPPGCSRMRSRRRGPLRRHRHRLQLLPSRTHQHQSEKQLSRHRTPSSPTAADSPITCRTSPCCPGISGRRWLSATSYSFPDPQALAAPAQPCPARGRRARWPAPPSPQSPLCPLADRPTAISSSATGPATVHRQRALPAARGLAAVGRDHRRLRHAGQKCARRHHAVPSARRPRLPSSSKPTSPALKSQGKKVMISLGGGGQHFTLADPKRIPNFVSSVTSIVTEYGFDGIDIDFESPSLVHRARRHRLPASHHAVHREPHHRHCASCTITSVPAS